MARFFFDVTNGIGFTEDEEGQEVADLTTARLVALEGMRSIMRDDVTAGFIDFAGKVDVCDSDHRFLLSIPFTEAVELRGLSAARDTP